MAIAWSSEVMLEQFESYQKQSYRTRCSIFASNGILSLTVPVVKEPAGRLIRDIRIDYDYPWIQQHERAIVSAYRSSAFFEYYKDDIFSILDSKEKYLFELNTKLLYVLMEACGLKNNIVLTDDYNHSFMTEMMDFRNNIHPKKESPILTEDKRLKPYYQVFSDKEGFKPNLSIMDLLFNEGPNAYSFLEPES